MALPDELTHAQRVALVRDYAQAQFVDRGMVADIALHAPGREGDERNHHAHILLTTREIGPEGFTTKNRDWNAVEVLEGWREARARDSNAALERAGIEDRVDHRTLVAQRDEARELATAARERGDEGAELHETVRAMSLDRPPLPQLSLGAWQLKERGIEVAAVRVWHEVKDRAVEVRQLVQELTGQVRDWLDRAAERVMDRLGPGQSELALAGGRDGREEEPDLATRLRDAWEARQGREKEQHVDAPEREAAKGVDREGLADRAAALREGREAEERRTAQEIAKEQERVKELERQQEIEREAHRDRGHGIER